MSTPDLGAIRQRVSIYRQRHYLGGIEYRDLIAHAPADLAALCDRIEELQVALVNAAIPLEVIIADEYSTSPMREISSTLRGEIRKGVQAIRAALAADPPTHGE